MAKRYIEQVAFSLVFIAGISLYYGFDGLQLPALVFLLLVSIIWVHSVSLRSLTAKDFGLTRENLSCNMLMGICIGFVLFALYDLLLVIQDQGAIPFSFGGSIPNIVAIFLISFGEEFFFRGNLQGSMEGIGTTRKIALVTLLFGLYKFSIFGAVSLPLFVSVVGSIVLGIEFEKTKSLIPPFLTHFTWDLLVYSGLSIVPWWVI